MLGKLPPEKKSEWQNYIGTLVHAYNCTQNSATFQAKEAQCHTTYDKRSKATALEVGDMVLVHVTAFKGCHKIQDQWENMEYIVEKQPYPYVPVYVVWPGMGKGAPRPYIGTIYCQSVPT